MAGTIILFWNPRISVYTKYDFARDCIAMTEHYRWCVGHHDEVRCGDRFFVARCGDDNAGICMSGVLASGPAIGPDRSGQGRAIHYIDLKPDVVIDSELHRVLSCNELMKEIPHVDWTGAQAVCLLEPEPAQKLEQLWSRFLFAHLEMFKVHAWWRRYAPPYIPQKDEAAALLAAYDFTPEGRVAIESVDLDFEAEGDSLQEAKELFMQELRARNYTGDVHITYAYICREENSEMMDRAVQLAFDRHRHQVDKAGEKYIAHIIRVAQQCETDEERIVALLHDIVEDSGMSAAMLREQGFPASIVDAVLAVTKREGEPYEDFIKRAAANPIGRLVKIADLEDNMTIQRLPEVNADDVERLNRYVKAWHYLTAPSDSSLAGQP